MNKRKWETYVENNNNKKKTHIGIRDYLQNKMIQLENMANFKVHMQVITLHQIYKVKWWGLEWTILKDQ